MKQFFKKYFIPHDGNDHHPYALRYASIRNALVLVLVFQITNSLILPLVERDINIRARTQLAAVLPVILANLTNTERQNQKLEPLQTNELLNRAAALKAQDMAQKGYFAHISPDGTTPWYWLDTVGYKYKYAGENLAIDFINSEDVTTAWMNSPTHRANIIKDKYSEVGTATATGMYQGHQTIFVVQVYARPVTDKNKILTNNPIIEETKNTSLEKFNSLEYSR